MSSKRIALKCRWISTPEDEILRREAAAVAGLDVNDLPQSRVLSGAVKGLYGLLKNENTGYIPAAKLVVACKLFDDHITVEEIRQTLEAVEGEHVLTERRLYYWVVLMFGDCNEEDFFDGLTELAQAAKSIRGVPF